MRINHNIASMVTQGSLFRANRSMGKTIEKLSTGLRVNTAADDAAGLGVSENLRTQVRGLKQALNNTQDAIAMLNVADGALNEQAEILQRMRELVIQARNDTYSDTERRYIGQEITALLDELDRIAAVTNYNGMQLFATPENYKRENGTWVSNNDNVYRLTDITTEAGYQIRDQRTVFTDPNDSVFGANEFSSSHHFNMMIGANYESSDSSSFLSARTSYDPTASNLLTVQLGQMDSNALLSTLPTGAGLGNASDVFGDFDYEIDGPPAPFDGDFWIAWGYHGLSYADSTVQDKFDYLHKLIDGDFDALPTNIKNLAGTTRNATGLERVNTMRAHIGAVINRLEHTVNNTLNQINNQQAAESMVRDADFASETANLTRNRILTQSATAMLAQANLSNSVVTQLLG